MIMFFQWVAPAEGVSSITLVNTPAPGIHHHLFCTHQLFIISSLCIIPSSMPLTLMELLIITTWLLQVPHHVNKIIMSLIIIIIIIITWLLQVPHVNITFHRLADENFKPDSELYLESLGIIGWPSLSWLSSSSLGDRLYHDQAPAIKFIVICIILSLGIF